MSHEKTIPELNTHKDQALSELSSYLDSLIESGDPKLMGKADKLSYWISDWIAFLDFEPSFSPQRLRRYKRGEIIKVHLGFNVGSEEGGLHYAVVVEKNNPKSSPVVTIVPLTSVKPNTNIERLPSGDVFLGNELFTSLNAKISSTSKHIQDELKLINELGMNSESHIPENNMEEISARSNAAIKELRLLDRMRNEVRKMRIGSIALVNQITTVSKIRIRDPKTDHDILSNIKLSNEKLDILDAEIQRRYTNF